jgi:hypothetical protein
MSVEGIIFTKRNQYGDFSLMVKDEKYTDTLFIYNDNIENRFTSSRGLGNAVIRPYNQYNTKLTVPRSAGITTGSLKNKGFLSLTEDVKKIIDEDIERISLLMEKYKFSRIFYSSSYETFYCVNLKRELNLLGMSLFTIGRDVREYITEQLYNLTV